MSHEERSESEHRSVLKGMTRAEALALVARMDPIDYPAIEPDDDEGFHGANAETVLSESPENITLLLALAALGAEVVGAREMWMARHTGLVYSNAEAAGKARLSVLVLPEGE